MKKIRSLTHWGVYDFHVEDNRIVDVTPDPRDPDPSPIGRNLILGNATRRIGKPAIRKSYLDHGPASRRNRGDDSFVEVDWDTALALVADELQRVIDQYGNQAIYAGSYGWASAGRFHHALSQLHRFMTCAGGYTGSSNAYSFAAAEVILPHVIGHYEDILKSPTSWPSIIENTGLMVCFGGMPLRNSQITNGGMGRHVQQAYMREAAAAGVSFVNISPSRADVPEFLNAQWMPIRPGTDVALMLALAWLLEIWQVSDTPFLQQYTEGFEPFRQYLLGKNDGVAKDPAWAEGITGIPARAIEDLARRMTAERTLMSLSWSLSRHQHGEQPYWAGLALAAMLGQIGLPGGGIGLGYGVENKVGKNVERHLIAALPRGGPNPVGQAIPVARIADMLLHPGASYRYNHQDHHYPDIHLVYWAGGNPFHHHQDLNRLMEAWRRPDTVICHELVWNATALRSDIVLPVASSLERDDIGGAPAEDVVIAMKQVVPPFEEARTDYEIFTSLADRLGFGAVFTGGRSEQMWLQHLYDQTRHHYPDMPDWETFLAAGEYHFKPPEPHVLFSHFRKDPQAYPLATTSGRIQISVDALGHPTWHTPLEGLGQGHECRFHLVSHQPACRLHSQLDHGETSQSTKVSGYEPLSMNPKDAAELDLVSGDVVVVHNQRGSFRAGLVVTPDLMPGVLSIATGAWWAPDDNGQCQAGNPNAVTPDLGTSEIAQGPSALTCLVNIRKADAPR